MIRNAMRNELATLLQAPPESRKPVIRRSLQADWLYATDLPVLFNGTIPEELTDVLASAKWEYIQEEDWLLLRKKAPEPPENWYTGKFGPEACCCRSLLERHSDMSGEPADAVQRTLIKAGEEGSKAYENACLILHREWAERLRRGESLPVVSRRYFGE